MTPTRFHNLDGFRFFAAFFVVIGHTELIKTRFLLPSFGELHFFLQTGPLAVTFFFVLSGFLIAYLLMLEKKGSEKKGLKINLKQFYKNRILRIWPLYYLLVLLVFLVFPYSPLFSYPGYNSSLLLSEYKTFALFGVFCPNLSEFLYGNILYLGQTWSLGVEEFFYLFFPLGIYFIRYKNLVKYFTLLVIGSIILIAFSKIWCNEENAATLFGCAYLSRYKIYAFALGAMTAYYLIQYQNNKIFSTYRKQVRLFFFIILIAMLALIFTGVTFSHLMHPVYAFIFAIIIFFSCASGTKTWLLSRNFIIYLGKISYGIYMLHPLAIVLSIKLFYFDTGNKISDTILFDAIVLAATIFLAALSYTFLEKPFLMKRQHTGVRQKTISL